MPRKPTGRPRGRPVGSGKLGEEGTDHTRLTVRIPTPLYTRLEAFAETDRYHHGNPRLADYVRKALEHYLVCPHRRQTENIPIANEYNKWQTLNEPLSSENILEQTENVYVIAESILEQTENVPSVRELIDVEPIENNLRQTENKHTIGEKNKEQTENVPEGQEARRRGRPGTMRPRILALLSEHQEGLTAEQIRAYLAIAQPIGDTLQGMRRSGVVRVEGKGHTMRYYAMDEQHS
jgi:hypothetical protein